MSKIINFINKIFNNIYTIYIYIIKSVLHKDVYIIRSSAEFKFGHILRFNWGDDFNFILIAKLTKKRFFPLPDCYLARHLKIENYMVIGSILTFFPLRNSIIWGSGIINNNQINRIVDKPKKVLAVRGPKTREALLDLGIECPEVYGDPALLAPVIYRPNVKKKYKWGIIPHYVDIDKCKQLKLNEDMHIINVSGYISWKDFIKEILSCDAVISSSLHGIIISEAYQIPCVWVKFTEYGNGWDFKFNDFYESIGKYNMSAVNITDEYNVVQLNEEIKKWVKLEINLQRLIDSCPFSKDVMWNTPDTRRRNI